MIHHDFCLKEKVGLLDMHHFPLADKPSVDFYSSITLDKIPFDSQAIAENSVAVCAQQVNFPKTVETVYQAGARVFIEMGANTTCTNWLNTILKDQEHIAIPFNQKGKKDIDSLTSLLATLISHGVDLDWSVLYPAEESKTKARRFLKEIIPGGSRVFDVSIEGELAEDNLDVFAEAGADAMLMKSYIVTVSGGVLNINFDSRDQVGGERHPIINAIEIISASSSLSGKFVSSTKAVDVLPETENAMRLYPNQASTFTTISFEESTQMKRVLVYDMSGRLVKSYNPKNNLGENAYVIDVNFYQQGNYIVKVVDEKGLTQSQLMIVKH